MSNPQVPIYAGHSPGGGTLDACLLDLRAARADGTSNYCAIGVAMMESGARWSGVDGRWDLVDGAS